jgi:hypothetical protein
MALARGENTWVGFGVESTLGTTVARTKFTDYISEGLMRKQVRKESGVIGGFSQRVLTELARWSEGPIEFEGNYEGMELLFKHAFGSANTVVASGAAFNSTFTLTSFPPAPGLSVEVNRDVSAFLYADCKIGQLEITQGVDEYLRLRFDFLGRAETLISASSPSFPADQRILTQDLVFKIATVATTIQNFRFTLNNTMAHRPQLGSVDRKEIQRVGRRRISGSFELDFEDTTQYNNFINQSAVALLATWTGATITGAEKYRLVLSMPSCKFTNGQLPADNPGPITETIEFLALEQTRGAQDECSAIIESTATSIP